MQDTDSLRNDLLSQIAAAPDAGALEQIRVSALGKKGVISELMRGLGQMSPDERKAAGPALNRLKDDVDGALRSAKEKLDEAALDARKEARAAKDFAKSDAIRDDLIAKGVEVMDGDPLGWDWKLDI